MKRFLLATLLFIFVFYPMPAENLLSNPSFESPAQTITRHFQSAPQQTINGWQIGGSDGSILETIRCPAGGWQFLINPMNYCSPADGSQYVNLSSQSFGATLSQQVETSKGGLYLLRFFAAAAIGDNVVLGPSPRIRVEVRDDNQVRLLDWWVIVSHEWGGAGDHPLVWQLQEIRFRATTPHTTITFSSLAHNEDDKSFIDNVSLEAATRFELTRSRIWMGFLIIGLVGSLLWYSIRRIRRRPA